MTYLSLIILFYVSFIVWKALRIQKKVRKQATVKRATVNNTAPSWISAWMEENGFNYFYRSNEVIRNYSLDISLTNCRVHMEILLNNTPAEMTVEVEYPVTVPEEKITVMRSLVKELNNRIEGCHFMMDKANGRLFLRYKKRSQNMTSLAETDAVPDLDNMLFHANHSFPEIMNVLYGTSTPAIAPIRIFGFSDATLN